MAERIEQDPYHWTAPKHLKRQGTIVRYLEKYPDSTVERFLEDAVKNKLSYISVVRLVKELVETRGVKPTTRHYTQLLYANSDPRNGNPYQVRRLLEEMEENDILADSATFHAALRVGLISRLDMLSDFLLIVVTFIYNRHLLFTLTTSYDTRFSKRSVNGGYRLVRRAGMTWSWDTLASANMRWH